MDIKNFIGVPVRDPEASAAIEFFQAFEPSLDPRLWLTLIKEEDAEVHEALEALKKDKKSKELKAALLKEICDLRYVLVGMNAVMVPHIDALLGPESEFKTSLEEMDENITKMAEDKAINFALETMIEAYYRVHKSNMSKLDDEGKPIRREDGKILKGPNYAAPDLMDLVGG